MGTCDRDHDRVMSLRPHRRRDRPPGPDAHPASGSTPDATGPSASAPWVVSTLADEIEAYLHGRVVDHLLVVGCQIPPWAAVNRLAHASRDELVRLVGGAQAPAFAPRGRVVWAEPERFLAGRLLRDGNGTNGGVRSVQSTVLVPLELSFIGGATPCASWTEALDAVDRALDTVPGAS
jgi:hypothetical protein